MATEEEGGDSELTDEGMGKGSGACLSGHEELRRSTAVGDWLPKRNIVELGLGGEDCRRCELDGGGGLDLARGQGQRLRPEDDLAVARPGCSDRRDSASGYQRLTR
jgi:hypothetical protein